MSAIRSVPPPKALYTESASILETEVSIINNGGIDIYKIKLTTRFLNIGPLDLGPALSI